MSRQSPIAVTGMGCVSPLGNNPDAAWDAYLHGLSASRKLEEPWASGGDTFLAAVVEYDIIPLLGEFLVNRLDRCSQFALLVA